MFNDDIFIQNNCKLLPQKIKMSYQGRQKVYEYKNKSKAIDLAEIKRILDFLYSIKCKHRLALIPIVLNLGAGTYIDDKLSYILLECICHYLIQKEHCKLTLSFNCPHTIYNEGIKTSYLKNLNGTSQGTKQFIDHFERDIYQTHYRNIIKSEDFNGEQTARTVQEIDSFLKLFSIQEKYRTNVSEIAGELIDNSLEHSKSDCLIDIDVTTEYRKDDIESIGNLYRGINIVVLNFSEILFGDGIAEKIQDIQSSSDFNSESGSRYTKLINAKKYHSGFWNESYSEEDFNIIASFQHKISRRIKKYSTGGTGLTQLVRGLEEESDAYNCYLLSGTKKINFIKNMLSYDDDNWVGFNTANDFLTQIPDVQCIEKSNIFFPGTAFNLNFVMKLEVD